LHVAGLEVVTGIAATAVFVAVSIIEMPGATYTKGAARAGLGSASHIARLSTMSHRSMETSPPGVSVRIIGRLLVSAWIRRCRRRMVV